MAIARHAFRARSLGGQPKNRVSEGSKDSLGQVVVAHRCGAGRLEAEPGQHGERRFPGARLVERELTQAKA